MSSVSQYYFDIISKRKNGAIASLIRALLWLFSQLFGLCVHLRKYFIIPYRPKCLVISVGNIVAGGTGKTPFCLYLAKALRDTRPLAIVLRGYKSEAARCDTPHLVLPTDNAQQVGDEALLLAKNLPNCRVYVGRSKVASVKRAESEGAKIVLLDDGFQHQALERDYDAVLIDAQEPFGYGYLLPRGLLREPVDALRRADLVVLLQRTKVPTEMSTQMPVDEKLFQTIPAPVAKARFQVVGIYDLFDQPQSLPPGTSVGLFCAIAKPEQFSKTVEMQGCRVVASAYLGDHETPTQEWLKAFAKEASGKGAAFLICTEKDRVKLPSSLSTSIGILWLKVELQMLSEVDWGRIIKRETAPASCRLQ